MSNRHLSKFVFLIFSFLTLVANGQMIEGRVLNAADRSDVPYVNISVSGTTLGTISKFDGRFELDVSGRAEGKDSLRFSAMGYDSKTILITKSMDTIYVLLAPNSVQLNSVLVSPKSPEEYIQMAIDRIPDNYISEPFNGSIYQRTMIRLNGKFMESSESILKGYIMPVMGEINDSTRLKMQAFKYFDQEEEAIQSIVSKRRKKKGDKMAIKGLDSTMLSLGREMSESFDIYTQIDSNMIKQLYKQGPQFEKTKFWYEDLIQLEDREIIRIGFKGRLGGVANQKGYILLDYESLAIEAFTFQVRSSDFKIRMLLKVMGINFNGIDVVFRFNSISSEAGWIPDLMSADVFIDLEKIKIFSKNIPIKIEVNTYIRFLDIEVPANDKCLSGELVKKRTPLQEQFKSDVNNPLWDKYKKRLSELK